MGLATLCLMTSQLLAQEEDGQKWISVDALNAGLGEPPEEVMRSTPRESLQGFLSLTEAGDYEKAVHHLDLTELASDEQAERGAALARQLALVLNRGDWLNVSDLPARQDAAVEDPSGQHPLVGQPRRNIKISSLDAQGQTHDIRIARYQVGEQDPVWLITADSLRAVPALYEEYGPSWLEDHIPQHLKASLGVLMVWEWLAIPIFLLVTGLVGGGVHRCVGLLAGWVPFGAARTFISGIRVPMACIAMALVAQTLLDYVVSFSGVVTSTFRVALIIIMAWGVGLMALRLLDSFLLSMTQRLVGDVDDTKHRDQRKLLTSLYALRRGIILITVVAVAVYVLGQTNVFGTLGMTLLASASVLTVLVGIAGQAVLGNILSSFQVSLAKPVRIGDLVVFEGQWCHVEGIFHTFIRLRSWDERRLVVPIKYFVSKPFENLSAKNAKLYRQVVMTLHLSTDVALLRQTFIDIAEAEDAVIEPEKLECHVTGQREMALEISCYMMTREPMGGWVAENNVREKLLAFIRDQHPEWWPREVTVLSHHDVTIGEEGSCRHVTTPATSHPVKKQGSVGGESDGSGGGEASG
ncbi:hypothetical protein GCM10017767_25210 [Halomonas urumqiensis]|nr:hypothetical protein GCM10017767_25210 [Halomonas urumqiensis]